MMACIISVEFATFPLVQIPSAIKFLGSIIFLRETKRRYKEK